MILRKIISFFILWIANAMRETQLENHQVRPLACS